MKPRPELSIRIDAKYSPYYISLYPNKLNNCDAMGFETECEMFSLSNLKLYIHNEFFAKGKQS